jgi:hypothetical protein
MVLRDIRGNESTVRYLPAVRQVSCAGFESAKLFFFFFFFFWWSHVMRQRLVLKSHGLPHRLGA